MPKIIEVIIADKSQVLYFDRAIDSLDYDEAIVQGIRFPAQAVIDRMPDGSHEYSKTSTAVVANFSRVS